MARRRRGSTSPMPAIVWLVLLAIPVLAVVAGYFLIDPNSFKPRIADAARAATGRELALRGPITIALSLTPTLRASDVGLANPPGFSRPELATLGQAEAQLALWPLLRGRIEITRLVLVNPDVMLETDDAGRGNWHLARPAAEAGVPRAASDGESDHASRFAVASVRIEGGRLTWRDGRTGVSRVAELASLDATEKSEPSPALSASAVLTVEGHAASVTAELGSFQRLLMPDDVTPWPMQVVVRTEGTRLAASGAIAKPFEGSGYAFTLDASAPDLAAFSGLVGLSLPALRDVSATARVSDASGGAVFSALAVRVGASDLRKPGQDVQVDRIEATAVGLDQPVHAEFDGTVSGSRVRVFAELGSATAAIAGPGVPFPVDLTVEAAGATLSAKGTVSALAKLSGFDAAIGLRVPDLAALGKLAGRELPGLRDVAVDGRISDRDGGPATGIILRGATITLPQADLAGDLVVQFAPMLSLQGQLAARRVDMDALLAVVNAPAEQISVVASPGSAPVAASTPARPARLVSDTSFNLAALREGDADLRLSVAELRWAGITLRDVVTRGVLTQGKLSLDPVSGSLPSGRLDGRLSIDGRAAELPVSLALTAPGMALKPLLSAAGWPDDVTGTVEVQADLTGTGTTPHMLAGSLSGKVGLVMTEGELDNRLLGRLSDVVRVARLPNELLAGNLAGRTKIRCFALRADMIRGVGTVSPLVLDTSRVLIQGAGGFNLGDETLALRLRPMVRSSGPRVVVPVRVTGNFQQLTATLDSGGALEAATIGLIGSVAGGLASLAKNPLGTIGNAQTGERGGDACGPAIAAARGARPVR